jgi:hypothetical protein
VQEPVKIAAAKIMHNRKKFVFFKSLLFIATSIINNFSIKVYDKEYVKLDCVFGESGQ